MQIERQRRYRTFLVVFVYLIVAMAAIRMAIGDEAESRRLLYSVALALALTRICTLDSAILGKPLPPCSNWLIFLAQPFSVPIYIIRARGMRGLGILAVHFLGIMVVWIMFAALALVAYGVISPVEDF